MIPWKPLSGWTVWRTLASVLIAVGHGALLAPPLDAIGNAHGAFLAPPLDATGNAHGAFLAPSLDAIGTTHGAFLAPPQNAIDNAVPIAGAHQAEPVPGIEFEDAVDREAAMPSSRLIAAFDSTVLRALATDVLENSPQIARAQRLVEAALARAPQVAALPDPVAGLMLFVLPPETRVGPQRFSVSIEQDLPWFGTLALKEQAMLLEAAAIAAEVEVIRLDQLTELRRLAYELSFLDAQEQIVGSERGVLVRYERAAQIRYAAGTGLQQEIVRVQAQITRIDTRLLEIRERRSSLRSAVNRLRDRPGDTPIPAIERPQITARVIASIDRATLAGSSQARPELTGVEARLAAQKARIELAEKRFFPEVTVGLSYTSVSRRDDAPGRMNPPPGNGDDILALSGSLTLPVWRRKLEAGVNEARAGTWAIEEAKRAMLVEIESSISDLTTRIPLLAEHLGLLNGVLIKQAREALRSAETAYSTGRLNAVDLLDAEVVLYEVRIAAERIQTDLAIALAQLEHAAATPIHPAQRGPSHD